MSRNKTLTIRMPSGISGDMLLTGLARLANMDPPALSAMVEDIGVPALNDCVRIIPAQVNELSGWRAEVTLPQEHSHRTFDDIRRIIRASRLTPPAKALAEDAFHRLAVAEGVVHNQSPDQVTFHEVGALDSILDVCLSAALFDHLQIDHLRCSPLPVCDGTVQSAHGVLATPAPAVLLLLEGVPVYGIDSEGETVTPTAISLLKAMGAEFGLWPPMMVERVERAYGGRVLPNIPNGAIFALGQAYESPDNYRS
ncbi:MAG: LarC family nickel insertion protein [Candidatus Marinimicrobia bacterium]|nr:LarC family nickel insertion protein [Candidatus Neomarinimicrobiota bacterium]